MDKVERKKLGDDVIRKLRKAILLGDMRPGEHLAEPLLADKFGTSRGPIRDALQLLIREGFVERHANGRVTVKGIETGDIANLYDIRLLLETYSIRKWADQGDLRDLHMLNSCLDRMNDSALTSGEFSQLDMEFHEQLVRLVRNKSLLQSWLGLKDVVHAILEITNQSYNRSEMILAIHAGIYAALEKRDIDEAVRLLGDHLNEGKVLMSERVDNLKVSKR